MTVSRSWRTRYLFYASLVLIIPFLLSVLDLHRHPISANPKPKPSKKSKSDHLVLGPAAGQGLPDRLQCQGLKALNMDESSRSRGKISVGDAVSFVTVFTVYNSSQRSESSGLVTVGNVSYSKKERSLAILNTFIDFIQAFLHTRLEQIQKLKSVSHYVFTDSDVAVVDDLGHIFQKYTQFHLALTFRNNKDQPLNSGFIAIRGTPDGILKAKIFLQEVHDVYVSKYMTASHMLGDQLALASVVKSHLPLAAKRFGRSEAFSSEINGASVLFLPCALYNWTPPEGAGQFHGMPLDVQVVHFKGSRKRLMLESWNFFNSTSNIPDMLCFILKSGRTNSLFCSTASEEIAIELSLMKAYM